MPDLVSAQWIKEQLRLCENAKRGPWQAYVERTKRPYEEDELGPWIIECGHDLPGFPYLGAFESQADAEFVAAAREGYPLALEALKNSLKFWKDFDYFVRSLGQSDKEEAADAITD